MNNKCKSGGAGRNEQGFLDLFCEFCNKIMQDEDEQKQICIALVAQESETANYLYTELKRYENIIKQIELVIIEDVPHQYQERLLELTNNL